MDDVSDKLLALVQEYGRLRLVPIPGNEPEHVTERRRLADEYADEVVERFEALGMVPPNIYRIRPWETANAKE